MGLRSQMGPLSLFLKSKDKVPDIDLMDIQRLDLDLLVTLDTLLAERNVSRAAKRLNLSQPAMSARLNRLRDMFEDQLLLPAQRGMLPTQRALEMQAPLHEALEGVRRVLAQGARFEPARAQATVAIAASDYGQYSVLMAVAEVLRTEAPGIRIVWRTIDAEALTAQMERGDVHVAVMTPESAPDALRMRTLYRERYVAIARTGHPVVRGRLDLDSFCALDHVVVSPQGGGFSGPADAALEAIGRKRRVVLSVPGFLIVAEIVARSDLIALVPYRMARDQAERLQVLDPPLPIVGFEFAMVWHDRTDSHPLQRWVRDRIAALAADNTASERNRRRVARAVRRR
jgi:DNA-binding transcriptional LysR family regulator